MKSNKPTIKLQNQTIHFRQHHKGAAEAQRTALGEAMDATLATRKDLHGVEIRITKIETDIVHLKWMTGVVIGGIVALLIKSFLHA